MERGQRDGAFTRQRWRRSLVIADAAALFDVLNPLANIRVVFARQVTFHELPQKLGRTVLGQVGGLGTRETLRRIGIDQPTDQLDQQLAVGELFGRQ